MYKPAAQSTVTEPMDCAHCEVMQNCATTPNYETVQLCQLRCGDRATIVKICGSLPMRRRLAEMGVLRGVDLVIKNAAPMGDPIAYEVKGYHLALRRTDAEQIEVRLVNPLYSALDGAPAEVPHG